MSKPLRVALFVGHKGPGTGAACYDVDEFEQAQKAAIAIGGTLMLRGHQPFICTGQGEHYLEQRALLAEICRPDVAVACHFNAHGSSANGCEVLFHPEDGSAESLALACAANITVRTGVHLRHADRCGTVPRADLKIRNYMHSSQIPTVLIEPLFLTSEPNRQTLAGPDYFRNLAGAVADSVELWAAVAAHGSKGIACQAAAVQPRQHIILAAHVALDYCYVVPVVLVVCEPQYLE